MSKPSYFIKLYRHILETDLTPFQKILFCFLNSMSKNSKQRCVRVGNEYLAEQFNCSTRYINEALRALESKLYILRHKKEFNNEYFEGREKIEITKPLDLGQFISLPANIMEDTNLKYTHKIVIAYFLHMKEFKDEINSQSLEELASYCSVKIRAMQNLINVVLKDNLYTELNYKQTRGEKLKRKSVPAKTQISSCTPPPKTQMSSTYKTSLLDFEKTSKDCAEDFTEDEEIEAMINCSLEKIKNEQEGFRKSMEPANRGSMIFGNVYNKRLSESGMLFESDKDLNEQDTEINIDPLRKYGLTDNVIWQLKKIKHNNKRLSVQAINSSIKAFARQLESGYKPKSVMAVLVQTLKTNGCLTISEVNIKKPR